MQLASILRPARSLLVLFACAAGAVHAAEVSAPVMLVATERLAGSGYGETVLIAAPLRNGASMGFIINRPTGVKLGALFPSMRRRAGSSTRSISAARRSPNRCS